MAKIITVTKPGGTYNGPTDDTLVHINADNVIQIIEDPVEENLSNSIIMSDNSKIYVKETAEEVKNLING